MKRVLATIVVGDHARKLYAITGARMQEYADMIGASRQVIDTSDRDPPHFAKYDLITQAAAAGVDELLYVDADVYIRQQAPDIFNHYTSAAFNEFPHPRPEWIEKAIRWIRKELSPAWPVNRYFNTGVIVIGGQRLQKLARIIRDVDPVPGVYFEQDQLNVLMRDVYFPSQSLAQKWNQCCAKEWITPKKAAAAYFLHGNGVGLAEKLPLLEKFAREYP